MILMVCFQGVKCVHYVGAYIGQVSKLFGTLMNMQNNELYTEESTQMIISLFELTIGNNNC